MKKKIVAMMLILSTIAVNITGCGSDDGASVSSDTVVSENGALGLSSEGKVFNIYCWNDEYKKFCEMYYFGTLPVEDPDNSVAFSGENTGDEVYYEKAKGVPEGVTINWVINPSDGGIYQDKLDQALIGQDKAAADDKVDIFLAEADYILKYVNSDYTLDVREIGVEDYSNTYDYTVEACTSTDGEIKGISYQCCPAAVIYRRSIAKDVLGTDDPVKVQEALESWEKFGEVAAKAKEKGYYMFASFATTFRAFSNNATSSWVDDNKIIHMDSRIQEWIEQTDEYVANGYCLTSGIWDEETTNQMFGSGKTMCFMGPAWYFQFSMGNAQDPENGCFGDWAICQGPMPHFWGGTWILAANGTDNPSLVADIMNTFINDEDVCSRLVTEQNQFVNNKEVNKRFADDPNYGVDFLGGQNANQVFCPLAEEIRFENQTMYDQILNEGLQRMLQEYWKGQVSKEDALFNFYLYINEIYPAIVTP